MHRNGFLFTALLVIIVAFLAPLGARAGGSPPSFQVQVTVGTDVYTYTYDPTNTNPANHSGSVSGDTLAFTSGGGGGADETISVSGNINGFTVSGSIADSNSQDSPTPDVATLSISNAKVKNNTNSTTTVVDIKASDSFAFPTTPQGNETISGSITGPSAISMTFTGTVSGNSGLSSTTSASSPLPAIISAGPQAVTLIDPYTLTSDLSLTIPKGDATTVSTAETDVAPTPAPSSWVLSFAGVFMVGGCYWLKRRGHLPSLKIC